MVNNSHKTLYLKIKACGDALILWSFVYCLIDRRRISMRESSFQETRRKQRFSIRKFSLGVESVLLGVTVFDVNLWNDNKVFTLMKLVLFRKDQGKVLNRNSL